MLLMEILSQLKGPRGLEAALRCSSATAQGGAAGSIMTAPASGGGLGMGVEAGAVLSHESSPSL